LKKGTNTIIIKILVVLLPIQLDRANAALLSETTTRTYTR